MLWNRFDICAAFYLYATAYHHGQWSKEYRIFGRLSISQGNFENDNQRMIYDNLVYTGNVRG